MVPVDQVAFILSRIQFGLSVGVHFLFPVSTLGITFFILIAECFHLKTGNQDYRRMANFGVKVLGMIFALGVATGIILPFAFGTNWSGFVEFAGGVFGIHLTVEAIVAFMLESVFLGVLLFGRNRVSKGVYLLSAFFVFLGSHLSGFIIISANSWMQTPFHSLQTLATGIPIPAIDGFHLETVINGATVTVANAKDLIAGGTARVVMDDLWKVIFNPTAGIRFLHTITACWLTGAVIFGAIAASQFLKGKFTSVNKRMMNIAVTIGLVASLSQALLGHTHIMETLRWQPTKNAAMEGIFKTQNGAPLYAVGFVDEQKRETYALGVPFMLSFLESFSFTAKVDGLDDIMAEGKASFEKDGTNEHKMYSPPVQATFQAFHAMVLMGVLLIAGFALAAYTLLRKKQEQYKWTWRAMLCLVPLPYIAVEAGWIGAEIGRQPWIVYGLMKTEQGLSVIPAPYVVFSLIIFTAVYVSLGILLAKWLPRIIHESLETLEADK